MKEISLHILDIVQNSIVAGADLIALTITEDTEKDILEFSVTDNGKGMSEELVKRVIDPFVTGRTTRKVGLGIPLLKHACEATGGSICIDSVLGEGTTLTARFAHSHIDRQPLGDMAQTMYPLIITNPEIDFVYVHKVNDKIFETDTREIKNILGGVPLSTPDVSLWLSEYLKEGEEQLNF